MPAVTLLGAARSKATAMCREIGVNVNMRAGIPAHDPSDGCGAPIVVQFKPTSRYPVPADALAYALPYKESGTCIHVFLDRVVRVNPEPGFAIPVVAHVMVHEITHVLEKTEPHSEEGMMKAHWSSQVCQRMEGHPLLPRSRRPVFDPRRHRQTHRPRHGGMISDSRLPSHFPQKVRPEEAP